MDGTTQGSPQRIALPATRFDRMLGYFAIVMLAIVLAALARGRAEWGLVPASVWAHLGLLIPALVLTPVLMIRPKGAQSHRVLGYVWTALMAGIAVESFFIPPTLGNGHFSVIWAISIYVLIQLPRLVLFARAHRMAKHQRVVRGLVIGSFLVAGLFTLPFGRMLGTWLFG